MAQGLMAIVVVCLSFAAPRVWAQSFEPAPTTSRTPQTPTQKIPKYPDSAKGLTAFTYDLLDATKKNDAATLKAYFDSLVLPDPNSWFTDVFEKDLAQESGAEYSAIIPLLPASLTKAFREMAQSGATEINGYRFVGTCDPWMNGNMLVLLSMRKHDKPLYEIHYRAGDVDRSIWAFAFVDGGFRYIGNTSFGFWRKIERSSAFRSRRFGSSEPRESGH